MPIKPLTLSAMTHPDNANPPRSARALPRPPAQSSSTELLCRLSRLLTHQLRRLDWSTLRFSEKRRLERALARLQNDMSLAQTITQADTAKKDE